MAAAKCLHFFSAIFIVLVYQHVFAGIVGHYDTFNNFIHKYKKAYELGSKEYLYRLSIFEKNLQHYNDLNKAHGNTTQVYGINKFSDLTEEEFAGQYLTDLWSSNLDTGLYNKASPTWTIMKTGGLPQFVDWRNKSVVSKVKNQKSCGACWAFSVVETAESMYALTTRHPAPVLAVQEVIDCSTKNHGCEGGDTCNALQWLVNSTKRIQYEVNYPLVDKTESCRLDNRSLPGVTVSSYTCHSYVGNEEQMLQLLSSVGPLTVTVDASTWNNYMGGVIQFHCPGYNNHAVEIVGYDLRGDVPYYIIRNSWGTDFGLDGYLYIKVGENLCGLAQRVSTVTVKV